MTTPSGKAAQSTPTPDQPEEDKPDQGTTENDPPQSGEHTHDFSGWVDNGDGTSSRICLDCAHMETRQDGPTPTQPSSQTGGCTSVVSINLAVVACCAVAFVLVKRRKS